MELRHLRYFIAVAEEENITRAAARLHVSQPPLSRQIRNLEEELGLELFRRDAKSVRLTDAGRVFLSEARAVVKRADEALQTARALAKGRECDVHIGYAPALTVEILPRTLRRFDALCPGVRVHLHDLSTQEMLGGLLEGRLHVGLMIRTAEHITDDLVFEKLQTYPICVAMHQGHPLARVRRVSLRDVMDERLVAYARRDYPEYHAWLRELFSGEKREPSIAEEHDGSTSLVASVEAGRGIALVQKGFEIFAGPRLQVRPITPAPPPFVVGVAYRKNLKSPVAHHLIAAAKSSDGISL